MTSIALPQEETVTGSDRAFTTDSQDVFRRNRHNAQHSTGPRTREGKSHSSQNARKHNLAATTPPRDLSTDPTYQLSKQEFIEEFQPATPAQHLLVSPLTYVAWKLHQIPKLERQLLATPLGEDTPAQLTQDSALSTQDYTQDPTNDLTAQHLLQDKPTPLTRLWDHHRRLLARFQSIVRQIRQLQRQEHEPFLKEKRDRQRRQKEDDAFIDQYLDQVHQRDKQQQQQPQTFQNVPTRTIPTPQKQNEPTPSPSSILHPPSSPSHSVPSEVSSPPRQNEPAHSIHVPPPHRPIT